MRDGDEEQALAPRTDRLQMAASLEEAREGQMISVDGRGNVRSMRRYRALMAVQLVAAGVVAAAPVIYGLTFGPIGAVVGGGLVGFVGLRIGPIRKLRRGLAALQSDRLDEAEAAFEAADRRTAARPVRVAARYNLAVCHARRRSYQAALDEARHAQKLAGSSRRLVFSQSARYLEIQLLVNQGRVGDARNCWGRLGDLGDGEYLRVIRWITGLYLSLAEGHHDLGDDELHERAIKGLSMTSGHALIALAAWAHARSGDRGQAEHLLEEATERMDERTEARLAAALPRLHEWMVEQRVGEGGEPDRVGGDE